MLKDFKKIGSTKTHTTFQHPDGHVLHVANEAIDKTKRNEMKRIPIKSEADARIKYAQGGQVKPPSVEHYRTEPQHVAGHYDEGGSVLEQMQQAQSGQPYQPTAMPEPTSQMDPAIPAESAQTIVPGAAPAQRVMPEGNPSLPGYNERLGAIQQQQALEQDKATKEQEIRHKSIGESQKLLQDYQIKAQQHGQMLDDMLAAAKNQTINPNRYMDSLSTPGKISTALGLILGGMGAGMAGGENPALKFLNSQIERDLEAQKADMGSKHNLLSALQQQMGHDTAAANMYRLFRADLLGNQLDELAATSKNPQAQVNALNAKAQLMQQYAPLKKQTDMLMALKDQQGSGADPSAFVPSLVPPEHQKEVFKEIAKAQDAHRVEGDIMSAFDAAKEDNTTLKTGAGYLRTPASISKMRALSLPLVHDLEGRVNEYEQKTLMDLEPKPGDTDAKIAQKRQALQSFIETKKAAPTAKAYGIDLNKSYPSAGGQPKQVTSKSGITYHLGSDGKYHE